MLSKIKIGKFLYIKDIELELTDGLNVFTGETGVGKSLIVDAISFVLGKKGKYSEGDYVELSFENVDNQYAEDGLLFLAREVKNGKSYYYVNGKRATLSTLKEASEGIIAIHGQHHQQALFNRKEHIKMLDKYAQIDNLLEKYRKLYREYKSLEKEEQELIQQQSNRLRELDILKYQLQELEEADLKEGEKQQLEERYNYLSNILKIKEAVYNASWNLSEDENSVIEKLSEIIKELQKVSEFSKEIQNALNTLEEAKAILEDAGFSLSKIDLDYDQSSLEEIENRLNLINRLEIKYNTDEKGLIALKEEFKNRIEQLENLEFKLPQIQNQKEKILQQVKSLAEEISHKRKAAAENFSKEITKHLKDLAMKEAVFTVEIIEKPLDIDGKDSVIFKFSANKGFQPEPIDEVASGGEISRLSLAIKLIAGSDVSCMIFDEIDTGIGGKTALYMAEKLKKLSERYQVILITHLPQIAVYGDKHFYVEKLHKEDYTVASIKELDQKERIEEIARMLSGKKDTKSLQLAQELLSSVR